MQNSSYFWPLDQGVLKQKEKRQDSKQIDFDL